MKIETISNTIAYGNTTAKEMWTLPAGCRPLRLLVDIETAFNSSGTDLLDIGKVGSNAYYANDVDVSSTGTTAITPLNNDELTAMTTFTAIFVQSVADATTGLATVILEYASPF